MVANPSKFSGKVAVEFFPSRSEVINLIDALLIEKGYLRDYRLINQDNHIVFLFNNSDIAYEVSLCLKREELSNPLYHLIKVSLSITPTSSYFFKITSSTQSVRHHRSVGRMKLTKRDTGLIESSPYLSPFERETIEKRKNKLKWLSSKGFNSMVGLYSSNKNYIYPNYVARTPSEPPGNHQFKDVNKRKWLSQSTFK